MSNENTSVESLVWVSRKCDSCSKDLRIRAIAGRGEQRWACPHCHRRYETLPEVLTSAVPVVPLAA